MNCTSEQFLSGSRLAGNENGRICRSDLRQLPQYITYGIGRANDFLEHRGVVDLFSQCDIFVSRPILDALAILDVRSRHIPSHQPPVLVVKRVVTKKEPAILAIFPASALLNLKR